MFLFSAGKNDNDQLGNNGSNGKDLRIKNPTNESYEFEENEIISFSAGRCSNVIVLKNGSCYGWGCNKLYEIGLPKNQNYSTPTLISFRTFFSRYFFSEPIITKVLCGHSFTLYLDNSGIVYFSRGNLDQQSLDKIKFTKEKIISINGYFQPLIISENGSLYQICDDYNVNPISIKFSDGSNEDPESKYIIEACCSKEKIICLTKKGTVCLSTKSGGGYANLTINKSLLSEKIVRVSCNISNYFFALSDSGKIFIHKSDTEGDLFTPIQFPNEVKIIDFSVGYDIACFIDSQNGLWCTGSPQIGVKKFSFYKPEKSSLVDTGKYRLLKVSCGYSHLILLADLMTGISRDSFNSQASDSPFTSQKIPSNSSPQSLPQEQKSSKFRFPFLSAFGSSKNHSTENSTKGSTKDSTENITENSNESEINIQNYEILKKIRELADQNEKLKRELEKAKSESKLEKVEDENRHLKAENERLLNLIHENKTKASEKADEEEEVDNDDCFGYKTDDKFNYYYAKTYMLNPAETLVLYDPNSIITNFHIVKQMNETNSNYKTYKISLNNYYGMKVLNFTESDLENSHVMVKMLRQFLREYETMIYNLHPCILKTYGFNFGDTTHPPTMLVEYCPLNLMEAVGEMKSNRMMKVIFQIAYGIRFLHNNHYIHRNLIPQNILIDKKWNAKISGFDSTKFIPPDFRPSSSSQKKSSLDQNNPFLAPEILADKKNYSYKMDIYSFGVLLLFILSNGNFPLSNLAEQPKTRFEVVKINEKVELQIPENINPKARDLIISCCNNDPDKRPGFDQILTFLKDKKNKIVNSFDEDKIKKKITEIELFEQT